MPTSTFAGQAATLYTTYHLMQILIYKAFIVVPRPLLRNDRAGMQYKNNAHRSKLSDSALAICISSAKACAYILETQIQRGMSNINNVIHSAFVCCGVLLIHWWGTIVKAIRDTSTSEARDTPADDDTYLHDTVTNLSKFMEMLDALSPRWTMAGMIL